MCGGSRKDNHPYWGRIVHHLAGMTVQKQRLPIDYCHDPEEVPDSKTVKVNGRTFEGPGVVVRKWPLRGVAIRPYGADMHTAAAFKAGIMVRIRSK